MSRTLVVDASVAVDLLGRFRAGPLEALLWQPDSLMVAPELLEVEVLNALRRLERLGAIPASRSPELPEQLRGLRIRKYRHDLLLDGIWSLRLNLTAYDAAYVALARLLKVPLVTRDSKLARAPGLDIEVLTP
ncbi:MAG: type II toxin-antitoxin system VapC family toxin [Rhodanobacteraceae bacterium]